MSSPFQKKRTKLERDSLKFEDELLIRKVNVIL